MVSIVSMERLIEIPGSFTVLQGVPGDGLVNTIDSSPNFDDCPREDLDGSSPSVTEAIADWKIRLSQTAKEQAAEWYHSVANNPSAADKPENNDRIPILNRECKKQKWWIDPLTSQLRIFSVLPQPVPSAVNITSSKTVPPGAICMGVALHSFQLKSSKNDNEWTFLGTCNMCNGEKIILPDLHHPRPGILQYLQIEAPRIGYLLFSVDGYTVLAPGMADSSFFTGAPLAPNDPDATLDSALHYWWWKVTCPAGAFVRQGVELTSKHLGTLPFGSYLVVMKKIVNAAGLSRLFIRAAHPSGGGRFEGWCSEHLNPMSGQRGPIVQPLSMAVPCIYKVVLRAGGTVRRAVELSSPVVGETLPTDTAVPVFGRAFTEFPANGCVPRICLYPKSAYASLRLNKPVATGDSLESLIFKPTGDADPSFDPERPGWYHWKAYLRWTVPSNNSNDNNSLAARGIRNGSGNSNVRCVCCEDKEPNATLVHGETGHICCCLECARVCKAQSVGCPICRLPIDLVILHFYV